MVKQSVLFVCLGTLFLNHEIFLHLLKKRQFKGNICRSPMGEAILHDLATKKGVRDQWHIDSAGTGGHEAGSSIYSTAQKVLKKYGITYEHIARQVITQEMLHYCIFSHRHCETLN